MNTNKNKQFKIGLYIRVSTEEQAENPEGSIRNQEDRLRSAVEYKNRYGSFGKIQGVYVDAGISAKDMKRPQLQELLKAVRAQEIDLVMVTELSRLSRNTRDFIDMWDMMRDNGCQFTSLREDFDTTNAAGELVLFQLMNLAQFERRQTSERVQANMLARAARGLYNGGIVPVGYKLIPDKPGYLEIDELMAAMVREAYAAYLREGCLSKAALWLNEQGYQLKKQTQGGGNYKRCGHFTTDNLQGMLRLKAYVGIKTYTQKGETKEVKAVWPPIIDVHTFKRVNKQLDLNKANYKPYKEGRFPYLLSGMVHCKTCKSMMPGKSATGSRGKIGYHEHSWNTKRDSTLKTKQFQCNPIRIPSRKLDPLVWEKTVAFVTDPIFMGQVLEKVRKHHGNNPRQKDRERINAKIRSIQTQVDALAERLSELPKNVSAGPIYKQMAKLQEVMAEYENQLKQLQNGGRTTYDRIVGLDTLESFARYYKNFVMNNTTFIHRKELVKKFISRVEVSENSVDIHFIADKDYYRHELGLLASRKGARGPYGRPQFVPLELSENSVRDGSSTLTLGAPGRT